MSCVVTTALPRSVRALAIAALAPFLTTRVASAQSASRDTTRSDSARVQRLERVMISAVRASVAKRSSDQYNTLPGSGNLRSLAAAISRT